MAQKTGFVFYGVQTLRVEFLIISDISIVLRETTLTISDSFQTGSPVEIEIVRVDSLCTTEIT